LKTLAEKYILAFSIYYYPASAEADSYILLGVGTTGMARESAYWMNASCQNAAAAQPGWRPGSVTGGR
jgi:hypothetical protein